MALGSNVCHTSIYLGSVNRTTGLFRRMMMHPQIIGNKGTLKKETWFWSWRRYDECE